jgi:hypothetical protein
MGHATVVQIGGRPTQHLQMPEPIAEKRPNQ